MEIFQSRDRKNNRKFFGRPISFRVQAGDCDGGANGRKRDHISEHFYRN